MEKQKIMSIAVIALCGFIVLSCAGGLYFYTQYTQKVGSLKLQDFIIQNRIVRLQKDLKNFSGSLNEVNSNIDNCVRNISILESRVTMSETERRSISAKVNMSERERKSILSMLDIIGVEIQDLQKTYADYVRKLNEMGELLGTNKSLAEEKSSTARDEEFVKEVDLGEIAVENADEFLEPEAADFYKK